MIILVDKYEQKRWRFPPHIRTEDCVLKDGDYAPKGYESHVRVERKSLNDLTNCVGDRELQRFAGQLSRLRAYPYRAVVVETTPNQLFNGKYRSPLPPDKVLQRTMDLVLRFKVLFFIGGSPEQSAQVALQFMKSAIKQLEMPQ